MNINCGSKMFLLCASLALASSALAQSENSTPLADVAADTSPTSLNLINGWYNAPYGTSNAQVEVIGGIVHFKGAIATTGTNAEAFVLPAGFRPSTAVYVAVDEFAAENGRLYISPNGEVVVQSQGVLSYAERFTSLDGASFALNSSGFKPITLINGWTGGPFGTSQPEVKIINGIVHLKGAISTSGSNNEPFVLPKAYRPASYVYASVDLCGSTEGQLDIAPSGSVYIEAETNFGNAECFTSLDGVTFAANSSGFKSLTLLNGWESEYPAKVSSSQGVVSLQGAIYTSGNNATPFVLPSSDRPKKNVYIPVSLCDGAYGVAKGRLNIQPNGTVSVQAEIAFSSAQCLTSLDGASFVK